MKDSQRGFGGQLRDTGIYFGSTALARLVPFLFMPAVTLHLGPDGVGTWSLFGALLTFSGPFVGLMLRSQVARVYHLYSTTDLAGLISSVLVLAVVTALALLGIAVLLLSLTGGSVLGIPVQLLYLIPVLALLLNVQELVMTILRYQGAPLRYFVFEVGETVVSFGVALWLMFEANWGWESFIAAKLLSLGVFAAGGLLVLWSGRLLTREIRLAHITSGLAVTLPLIPHTLSTSVIGTSDRIILEYMTTTEDVGIYSTAYLLGSAVLLFSTAFSRTWLPWVHKQLHSENAIETHNQIVRWAYIYFIAVTLLSVAFWGACHLYIVWMLDPRFQPATAILPWVVAAMVLQSYYFAVFPVLTFLGKTAVFASATMVAAVTNLVLTVVLVRATGMVGAAIATLVAYAVLFGLVFFRSQQHYPLPWRSVALATLRQMR